MKTYKKVQVWIGVHEKGKEPEVLLFRVLEYRGEGWHPVTGSVEKGEAVLDGAKRETQEETGLTAPEKAWIDLKYVYSFEGQWGKAEEYAFGLILPHRPEKITLDPTEHLECKWSTIPKALDAIQFPDQKRALEIFAKYFK